MTEHPLLKIEHHDGGIVVVTMNRAERLNALNRDLMAALTAFARDHRRDAALRAVIVTGAGPHFSAGADLKERAAQAEADQRPSLLQQRSALAMGPDLCEAWEQVEAITIAAIEGHCLGGGCALALACDFRIAARGARIRLPEVPLGMNMSWQSLPRLTALVGPARAKRFTLYGRAPTDDELMQWGLVDELAEPGQALAAARRWAADTAALPPIPVRMTKEAINAHALALRQAASVMDRDQFLLASGSADLREGVRAAARRTRSLVEDMWIGLLLSRGLARDDAEDVLWLIFSAIRGLSVRMLWQFDQDRFDRLKKTTYRAARNLYEEKKRGPATAKKHCNNRKEN